MELEEIEISIDARGHVQVEVRGVKGPRCLQITREMERLLGDCVLERTHTHEHDQQPDAEREDDWLRSGDR